MSHLPGAIEAISKPQLFEAFKLQLCRDLENCGLANDFVSGLQPHYEELLVQLGKEIKKIGESRDNKLSELLYRIDVPEQQVKTAARENAESEFNLVVAGLIIKRELQKVVLKELYRNK